MKSKISKTAHLSAKENLGREQKLDELIVQQGVGQTATFEHLLGTGADLWDDDGDFKRFLETVKAIRHEKG